MDSTALPTYRNLPEQLRRPFLNAICRNPVEWLVAPRNDEVFDSFIHFYARLQAYALGQGFAVVKGKNWSTGTPRRLYHCIYHGTKRQNDDMLEAEVQRDTEDNIISRRQRNGVVNQKWDCKFECLLSYKSMSWRSEEKSYVLTVKYHDHTHELFANLLAYTP